MAEGFLKKKLLDKLGEGAREIHVSSAGTAGIIGGKASFHAIEVMREKGIDIIRHISRPLNRSILKAADIIFTLTETQGDEILALYPDNDGKFFLFGECDIRDPIGLSKEEYR